MSADLKKLIVEQAAMLTNIEKILRNIKKDSASRKTEVYLRTRLESVARLHLEFRENHRTLMRASDDEEIRDGYVITEIGDKFEEVYIDVVSLLRSDLPTPSSPPPTMQQDLSGNNSTFERSTDELKLPTVKLPVFSGKFTDWPAFKEMFEERVHQCARFSNLYRFYYLKDALSEEAARDIQHLSLTEANYPVAWQILINIYDNKRVLFVHYMDTFEQQSSVAHDDPAALKRFVQTCRSCVNSIDRLGVDLKQNQILVYLMARKLSNDARLEWEKSLAITQDIPTFEQFCTYLDAQYRTMITASTSIASTSKYHTVSIRDQPLKTKRDVKSSFATGAKHVCVICNKGNHSLRECATFLNMQISDRKTAIGKHKLCFNCLGYNHVVAKCPSQHLCHHCGGHHHTLIHMDRAAMATNNAPERHGVNFIAASNESANLVNKSTASSFAPNCEVLLPTAIVSALATDGAALDFRAFLDQGSQASFISERAVQMLRLERRKVHVRINGLANTKITEASSSVTLTFKSKYNDQLSFKVNAFVLSNVGSSIPDRRLVTHQWTHINDLRLADPTYHIPQSVDLLLGSDIYDELMLDDVRRGARGTPIAQNTILGYIISGKAGEGGKSKVSHSITVASVETLEELESLLRKYWELDDITNSEHVPSETEKWCEEFYKSSHRRLDNGKYVVKLPLLSHLDSRLVIGSSYEAALKRLNQLQRRLSTNPDLKAVYNHTIREYLELGQMRRITEAEDTQPFDVLNGVHHCYLPHHPVVKESSSTTKVRVVFDGSMRTSNGKSLNDILAVGPKLHTDLTAILINWRVFKYVFLADVEKMYRCIDVDEKDADFQRILWYDEHTGRLEQYMCTTVMFGTSSAPFIALRTMQQLAADEAATYPLAVKVIKEQMYVDDILAGADSVKAAKEIQNQVIGMLNSGTFQLRKWASNCSELLKSIPQEHREVKNLSQLNSDEIIKALGLYWNPIDDEFRFRINFEPPTGDPTKRKVLSTIARLFDPMGWLSPVVISAKIFMQRLWRARMDWDQTLPSNLARIWIDFVEDLQRIADVRVPRFIMCNASTNTQLHIFCDASSSAYGAAAYIRGQRDENHYEVQLLLARCKVLPIKPQLTIPRAELCAAVLAAKMSRYLKQNCHSHIYFQKTVFWTDSTIVLSWIRGGASKWKVFVANRVDQILQVSEASQWRHVASEHNPADHPSRGLKPNGLVSCDLWWHGPQWLIQEETNWPEFSESDNSLLSVMNNEMKPIRSHAISTVQTEELAIVERFSSYTRMVRVLAYCKRFGQNCRLSISQRNYAPVSVIELRDSLLCIIRIVQREGFASEFKALSSGKSLHKESTLLSLNPFFDEEEQVIRLGGRLRHALLSSNERHPYILPSKGHFVDLVVNHCHLATLHGGVSLTLSHIRKTFWIMKGRQTVRTAIHRCMTCYRLKPKGFEQMMGALPAARVRPAKPFSSVGVDYAGPISISPSKGRGRTSMKGYVAVFVCLATKAIHLEPVGDLTADAFIGALHRFIGRRGLCRDIYSDCGTNFVGANTKLQCDRRAYRKYVETKIAPVLMQNEITWHFIPPSAPHFGGLWEAGVKSMKFHLRRTIGDRVLTFEEVATVLAQIESCLNSRPLCPISNDPDDLFVLTPGHFLTGDSLLARPVPDIPKISLVDRWRSCQYITQQFWRNWSSEYLSRLQRRPKWLSIQPNVRLNELVLIKDERFPPNHWPLGRIMEVHPGKDGLIRVVTLKTQSGIIKRPVTKLCPLPTQEVPDVHKPDSEADLSSNN